MQERQALLDSDVFCSSSDAMPAVLNLVPEEYVLATSFEILIGGCSAE